MTGAHATLRTGALFALLAASIAVAEDFPPASPPPVLSRFGDGTGPAADGATFRLLDATHTNGQSNAIAFERAAAGAPESVRIRCKLRALEGGDGGAIALLSTAEYGVRGPAPFVAEWTAPNLRGTFAVGIDVHEPKDEQPFGPWGNYQGRPERLVSLHWDGREIAKRVAPAEFRGEPKECEVSVDHTIGGADVTVRLAGAAVFERFFVPGLLPYESRLAIGAGTRADAATEFDVTDLVVERGAPAKAQRAAQRVELFNHVLTDNKKTAFESEAALPPLEWAFGRVILTLEIHDAGASWDEWDRCGELSLFDDEGVKRGIVPFITSYRTPCRWQVDVTHFRPWLAGKRRFEIEAGTNFYKNRGYMMSASLDFHHGAPEAEAFRIVPLWNGTARHGSAEIHFCDFFKPVTVPVDAETTSARVFVTTTGHSQVGEFTPSARTISVVPDKDAPPLAFENTLWKDDCWLNANRPQYGTWKYSRAGWAPGDVVAAWWIDLGARLVPGKSATFTYEPKPYDFTGAEEMPTGAQVAEASHNVRSYVVLYRKTGAKTAAPSLLVTNVSEGSSAAKAGLREGDWLASYDGRPLVTVDDLRNAIAATSAAAKESVEVVTYRGAERLVCRVGPGKLGVGLSDR